MKKVVSKTLIIISAIILALAAIVVTLSFIPVKKLNDLDGYKYVSVVDSDSFRFDFGQADDADKDAAFKEGLDKTGFSIMHGILEGKFDVDYKFVTEKDEDDEDVNVNLDKSDLEALSPSENQYKVTFVFDAEQNIRVKSQIISFDRAVIIVPSSENKIVDVEIYLYEDAKIGIEDGAETEAYTFTPVSVRANIGYLYNAIDEIRDSYGA